MTHRIILYPQDQDGKFECVLEKHVKNEGWREVISERNEKAIYAFIHLKAAAIMAGLWNENDWGPARMR